MLTNLHVKNLALIDEVEVNFTEGLNILTGETGTGKSIIIGAVNYCLGEKVKHDVIRTGQEYALVELVFVVSDELKKKIEALDFLVEEDNSLILTRKIMPNRSIFKVCGETVTVKQMKDLASLLIDIHGQHEHQSLISKKYQGDILDKFGGEELEDVKNQICQKYNEYIEISNKINSLNMDESLREREISLAEYEVNEIENANLKIGEDELLEAKYKCLQNAEKIATVLANVNGYLKSGNETALNLLGYAVKDMGNVSDFDDDLSNIYKKIVDAEGIINEVSREIDSYMDAFEYSEQEYDNVSSRLDIINSLTLKYGGSIENVLNYLEQRIEALDELKDVKGNISRLEKQRKEYENEILNLCTIAHDIRVKTASNLSQEIEKVLVDLNFLKVKFEIAVNKMNTFTKDGFDDIEFMISLNPGEDMMPIKDVASGGELSRIMLALKTVFARKDEIGTLIFDEIDSGISGKTAWKVSERMNILSSEHQVISITHLPQIAAMADTHFKIEKNEENGKTTTSIYALDKDGSINELSRMLGGDVITDTVRNNAIELIELAKRSKQLQ